MEWKTIDSAPRDRDNDILVYCNGKYDVVYWFGSDNPEMQWFNGDIFCDPTHWIPLPNPPQKNEEV